MLDRDDEIRERYGEVVRDRPEGTSPAHALRALVVEDIERFRDGDPALARGEFPALCLKSSALRRYALEARERQVDTVSAAIVATCPSVHPLVARAHAAGLICVVQTITDQIGGLVLEGALPDAAGVDALTGAADLAFDDLDRSFLTVTLHCCTR